MKLSAGGFSTAIVFLIILVATPPVTQAELTDITQTPNTIGVGIQKSFEEQIGEGRGDPNTPNSSLFLIHRDPFRAIKRGQRLFKRKHTLAHGLGLHR